MAVHEPLDRKVLDYFNIPYPRVSSLSEYNHWKRRITGLREKMLVEKHKLKG